MTETSANPGTPSAEVTLDERQVRALLQSQHPDLADLSVTPLASGWDNLMFRLGDALCLRFPRRQTAVALIENEQRWLPELAPTLPLPIPAPQRLGQPGSGYPWPWSVVPWLPGDPADLSPPASHQAETLAAFLRALHRPAPDDAPTNPVRGVPLRDRHAAVEERMRRLRGLDALDPRIVSIWDDALTAPIDVRGHWLHGDLHPQNLLVDAGRISGVIDWGDVTSGDVATDLACFWMLFPGAAVRQRALETYAPSQTTYVRARGWAAFFGIVLLDTGLVDNPRHAEVGRLTLSRLTAEGV